MRAPGEVTGKEFTAAASAIGDLAMWPLARLSTQQLKALENATMDVLFPVFEEKSRREKARKGDGPRLRLVTKDGELTAAGERMVRARRAARARWCKVRS